MEKINVLVLPSDTSGVGKFRSVDPHAKLQNMYPQDFHIDIEYSPNLNDLNFWKKYQIVHFHRSIGNDYERAEQFIKVLRSMGIIKVHEGIKNNLREASYVTTTTELFANEIRKLNKNVVVFPNAIDPKDSQFNEPTLPSEKLRIGWLGGSSHLHDLKLVDSMVSKLLPHQKDLQYYICGFDTRGVVTELNQKTGEKKQRPIRPEETVWVNYERIFTDNYKIVSEDYRRFLNKFEDSNYSGLENENYVRVWTRPVNEYARNYSKFDVSLAPIKNHIFNRMKSQLKVIEAGFYKKALIASKVGPYTIDLKHSLENGKFVEGNALLVDEARNHSDWAKFIKKLNENRSLVYDLGQKLYETVKNKYDLNNVSKLRSEFYKTLIN